jgi:DNA-binding CsgD family transcriptional regulator
MIFEVEKIENLVAQCRLADAAAAAVADNGDRSLRAALYVLAGEERNAARYIAPELLACRSAAEVAALYAGARREPNAYDYLIAGAVLAWLPDEAGACDALRTAHDCAAAARRFDLAVAARERLAHHALLFGATETARQAIGDAIALAKAHQLASWLALLHGAAAQLAVDAGDLESAAELLSSGQTAARTPEELAYLAPAAAQLAVELGDDASLRDWASAAMLHVALGSDRLPAAIGAASALAIAASSATLGESLARALRRSLLHAEASSAPELFSIAARYAHLDDARFAVATLAAVVAPQRRYLNAHQLLARAYFLLRSGEGGDWVSYAGDAARAFTAMGLRRWTNDAMTLLVSQEPPGERRVRGRASASTLTGREEQVAHLIRRGARNREVAAALQISEHTVERHVSSILGRLGLRSRWQIADSGKSAES